MTNNNFFVETSLLIVLNEAIYCDLSNLLIVYLSKVLLIAYLVDQIRLSLLS
jgi:hypothetical protein